MQVIGLSGVRFSGKTFLAHRIKDTAKDFGLSVEVVSFALPLKLEFCKHKGMGLEMLNQFKENYREEMEEFSNKVKAEHKNPNYFSDLLFDSLYDLGNYVIDDVRLLDEEVLPLLARKAHIYRVVANTDVRIKRGLKPNPKADHSRFETELDLPQEIFMGWGGRYIYNHTDELNPINEAARLLIRRDFLGYLNRL